MQTTSLQDKFAPKSLCFGCGPSNTKGLQIKSFIQNELVVAHFTPEPYHHAFPQVLNGGIIATILDCHSNWAACWYLMQHLKLDLPPCTVTAAMSLKLHRPTPMGQQLMIKSELQENTSTQVKITSGLYIADKLYVSFKGTFAKVSQNHPAYHRW